MSSPVPLARSLRTRRLGYRSFQFTASVVAAVALFADLTFGKLRAAEFTISVCVAAVAIFAASRKPGASIGFLLVFVPLQLVLLAYLYKLGAPAGLARNLGYLKDAAVAGVCVAAVNRTRSREVTRFDLLDAFAVGYAGIATAYLLLPALFSGVLGGESFSVRLNAWRLDCLFVVLFVAARRVAVSPVRLHRLRTLVLLVAIPMFGFAVWESVSASGYNHFMVSTIELPNYQRDVLNVAPPFGLDYVIRGVVGDANLVRVGGLFADSLTLGFYLVLPLAFATERLSESRLRPLPAIGLVCGGVTLVLTQTRSAILSGTVALLLGLWLAYRRLSPHRLRAVVLTLAAVVVLTPLAAHSTIRARFDSLFSTTQDADNQSHKTASLAGLNQVIQHPVGRGLGANPATGLRNHTSNATVSEDSYLQVGTELGLWGMLTFIGLYIAMLVRLRRRASQPGEYGDLAAGCWLAGCGLLIGGLFLHVWISLPLSLSFWGLAGLAIGHTRPPPPSPSLVREPHAALVAS
jgi:hypothetical protein